MTNGTTRKKTSGLKDVTRCSCRMPLFMGRWRHRVYVCDCNTLWTVKSKVVAPESPAPIIVNKWIRLKEYNG
jgi:hypothetical protein